MMSKEVSVESKYDMMKNGRGGTCSIILHNVNKEGCGDNPIGDSECSRVN